EAHVLIYRNKKIYMLIVLLVVLHWYFSLFHQTFFHHRYFAHKMFTMSPFWERYFWVSSYLAQGSAYLSPRTYAILHRLHHKYSDGEKDPHSPLFSHNPLSMMWKTKNLYSYWHEESNEPERGIDAGLPKLTLLDKIGESYASRILWAIAYLAIFI